jgi:hypothetical protein
VQNFETVAVDSKAQALAGGAPWSVSMNTRTASVERISKVADRIGRGSGRRTISVRSAVIFMLSPLKQTGPAVGDQYSCDPKCLPIHHEGIVTVS